MTSAQPWARLVAAISERRPLAAVPAGIAGALLGLLVLPVTPDRRQDQSFDWWGAATFGPAIALGTYAP